MDGQLRFPLLTAARFAEANERAREAIRNGLQPPRPEQFKANVVSMYPRWFLALILTLLGIMLVLSFVISGGKQAAAAGMLFDHLPSVFSRLSPVWASFSVISMLLLSEIGAVLFLIGSGTVAQSASNSTIGKVQVNPTALLFRLFALLCAGYAILSNVTVTALDPVPQAAVLQWAVAIGIPTVVLGLGSMLERMMIDYLKNRNAQQTAHKSALESYQLILADPAQHASWNAVLADELWKEMTKYKRDRDMLETLVGEDRNVRRTFLILEHQAQRRAETIDWNVELPSMLPELSNSVAAPSQVVSDSITSAQTFKTSQKSIVAKPAQVGPAVAKAKAWLEANPDHGLPLRQAADLAGVSKDSMARAMQD